MAKASKTTVKSAPKTETKNLKKWKWTDTEDIAFRLIDLYPNQDPLRLRFTDLHKKVCDLKEFGDDPKKSNEKILEAIQMCWSEERADMEDELGPVVAYDDEDTLDEDDYRDDELATDAAAEVKLDAEADDEDEDEDEFGDGFQEEGADEH